MDNFIPRKIKANNLFGEQLQQARLFKQLSIEEISQKINIPSSYLLALEEERLDDLPLGLYGKNYLKKYAEYLQLDSTPFIALWNEINEKHKDDDPFLKKVVKKHKFIVFPKIFRNILLLIAVGICFFYLAFYFKKITFMPPLKVNQPNKDVSLQLNYIDIQGHTDPKAEVKINGEAVLNNNNGDFNKTINLKTGINQVIIEAKKKYSKKNIIIRQILVETN